MYRQSTHHHPLLIFALISTCAGGGACAILAACFDAPLRGVVAWNKDGRAGLGGAGATGGDMAAPPAQVPMLAGRVVAAEPTSRDGGATRDTSRGLRPSLAEHRIFWRAHQLRAARALRHKPRAVRPRGHPRRHAGPTGDDSEDPLLA